MVRGEERGARQFEQMARHPVSGLSFPLHASTSYLWRRAAGGRERGGFFGVGVRGCRGTPLGETHVAHGS